MENLIKCNECKQDRPKLLFMKDTSRVCGLKSKICKVCYAEKRYYKKEEAIRQSLNIPKDKTSNELASYPVPDWKELYKPGEGYTTAIFGSSRSGKTTFLKWLYSNVLCHNYDIKVMFSTNSHLSNYDVFKKNDGHLYDKLNNDLIRCLHAIQKKTNNYYNILLMTDDIVSEKNNPLLKEAFITYRNANISTMLSLQGSSLLDKNSRNCIHRLILMKMTSNQEIEDICERLLMSIVPVPKTVGNRIFDKKKWLYDWYIENTKDYNFIVIDLLDNYKIYKYKCSVI